MDDTNNTSFNGSITGTIHTGSGHIYIENMSLSTQESSTGDVQNLISKEQIEVFHKINHHFNEDEVKNLSFELQVDYESLGGQGKNAKVRELILSCLRNNLQLKLLELCESKRPKVIWR